MFAPRVARPQTKASEGSTSGLTPQRPTNVDHALDHGPVEQAPFLQGEIVNHARARLLARRDSALPGNGRNRGKEREGVGGEDASAETAPRGVWWDFSKVSLFHLNEQTEFSRHSHPLKRLYAEPYRQSSLSDRRTTHSNRRQTAPPTG